MYRRILGLGTYPIVNPVHGGQRRVASFKQFYQSIGIEYQYACVYDQSIYPSDMVGANDIPLGPSPPEYQSTPFIGDLLSGRQAASHAPSFEHFMRVVERFNPDALQLEQCFMWPLAREIVRSVGERHLPIIYSSQNVEAPLKRSILSKSGVAPAIYSRVCDEVEQIEIEASTHARMIICVSTSDRAYYLRLRPETDVIGVANGVDRPPAVIPDGADVCKIFAGNRFLLMVGSAYPPNVDGACDLVVRDGVFHCPPIKSLAVCGAVSHGIFNSEDYRRYVRANERRVQFFPEIDDRDLWALKAACHASIVAVGYGGGSSLKAAEALALGKWVIANSVALRGFEDFADAEGVIRADNRADFRRAMAKVLRSAQVEISPQSRQKRETLYWDRCFLDSGLADRLEALQAAGNVGGT